jgi:glutathione S-transferase
MWALEEVGADYDLTIITREEAASPEHAQRHPLNRVPVLYTDDGDKLFESSALILHVADLHPDAGLIPPPGTTARGLVYQWTLFGMTEMEPHGIAVLMASNGGDEDGAKEAAEKFNKAAKVVEDALGDREYLLPSGFSAADIVIGSLLNLGERTGAWKKEGTLGDYLRRLEARDARKRAYAKIGQ